MTNVVTAPCVLREGEPPVRCLLAPSGELAQLGRQLVEGRLDFAHESLAKDFPMLGLGRTPMARRTTLQARDQVVVQFAHVQIPGHYSPVDLIAYNEIIGSPIASSRRLRLRLTRPSRARHH